MAQPSRAWTLETVGLDLTQVMAPLSYLGLQRPAPLNYPVVRLWVTGA